MALHGPPWHSIAWHVYRPWSRYYLLITLVKCVLDCWCNLSHFLFPLTTSKDNGHNKCIICGSIHITIKWWYISRSMHIIFYVFIYHVHLMYCTFMLKLHIFVYTRCQMLMDTNDVMQHIIIYVTNILKCVSFIIPSCYDAMMVWCYDAIMPSCHAEIWFWHVFRY